MPESHAALDWTMMRSFLAVAETGSLSAAAARLGQSQPTLGRHIKALEESLGAELFHRHARGLVLTPLGSEILPQAEAMRQAVHKIELSAEAQSGSRAGVVRVACSLFVAHHVLPPIVAGLRAAEPGISITLIASDESENLLFREADLAVRMYRPEQLELVARHVTDIEMGVFAAHSYAARRGLPTTLDEFWNHDIVGYDQSTLIIDRMREMDLNVTPEMFAVRCDNHPAYWELVAAGCGIGFTQSAVGRADPRVVDVPLDIAIPTLPVWLTAHPAVRRVPRVDLVWRHLDQGLRRAFPSADIDAAKPAG